MAAASLKVSVSDLEDAPIDWSASPEDEADNGFGVWPGMNDLPELVAIPNLILAALQSIWVHRADLRFARLHAADQIEGARAIRPTTKRCGGGMHALPRCGVSRNRKSFRTVAQRCEQARKTYERSMYHEQIAMNGGACPSADAQRRQQNPRGNAVGCPLEATVRRGG